MLLLTGQVVGQLSIFIRNVIIARMIGSYHFGIGSIFLLTATLFEMMSNVSLDKFLIQAEDGDDPNVQRTAQMLQFARGMFGAIVIFLIAGPLSHALRIPEATWAFRCLALVPLLGSFRNLDVYRLQRAMNFAPEMAVEVTHQLVSAAAGALLAWWLRDYSAVLWVLVLQWGVWATVSNVCSERRYQWSCNLSAVRRIWRFGWPLLINGLLMFVVFQGDRLVIAAAYDMSSVGIYAVAFGVVLLPSVIAVRIGSSLFLPLLAANRRSHVEFNRGCELFAQLMAGAGCVCAVGSILVGGLVIEIMYGRDFHAGGRLVGILGAAQGLWILRAAPTSAALARGDGVNSMVSNVARASSILCSVGVALTGADLLWIPIVILVGEIIAALTSIAMCRLRQQIPIGVWFRPAALATVVVGSTVGLREISGVTDDQRLATCILAIIALAVAVLVMTVCQQHVRRGLRQRMRVPGGVVVSAA